MLEIDGVEYDVVVSDVELTTEFLMKFAERVPNHGIVYEVEGIYFNQSFTLGTGDEKGDMGKVWDVLSSLNANGDINHTVLLHTPIGRLRILMYPDKVSIKMVKQLKNNSYWTGMTVQFIPIKAVRE